VSQPSIHFPLIYDPGDGGVSKLLDGVARWIASDPIAELLALFPSELRRPPGFDSHDPFEVIDALWHVDVTDTPHDWEEFGTTWDSRDDTWRQLMRERVELTGKSDFVIERAAALGLRESSAPTPGQHDAFISLGGARLAPLCRTRQLVEHWGGDADSHHLVLLGVARPLNAKIREPEVVAEYAPDGPQTEFDLMVAAGRFELQRQLSLSLAPEPDEKYEWAHEKPYEAARWWTWSLEDGRSVHGVQAPTARPGYPANTAESVDFVARGVEAVPMWNHVAHEGAEGRARTGLGLELGSVVLSTSAIYVTFQHLDAVGILGIDRNCRVQTVAHPIAWSEPRIPNPAFQTATTYLQEVRSTFQAALRLVRHLRELERG
jgi:hypothetical protein